MLGLIVRAEEKGEEVGMTLEQKGPVQTGIRPGPLRGLMLKAGCLYVLLQFVLQFSPVVVLTLPDAMFYFSLNKLELCLVS